MTKLLSAVLVLVLPLVANADECEFIRKAVNDLPDKGGVVQIPAGTYNCKDMIVLKKDNVTIRGAGQKQTVLRLADQAHAPVLVIGNDKVKQNAAGEWITETRVKNIEVSDLTVDGNLANHDPKKECGQGSCDGDVQSIRNNAITIRGASDVRVLRVTAHDSISGGLVTEKFCDHLLVKDFTSHSNYFDGFAGYQTEDSLFENVNLSRNRGAGISIDIDFSKNHFRGGTLASNGDVGIFARDTNDNVFEKLKITRSGNHGAFIADDGRPGTCANRNEFRSVKIDRSKGHGIHIASPCTGNKVTGKSVILNNEKGCYYTHKDATIASESGVVCKQTIGSKLASSLKTRLEKAGVTPGKTID